MANRYWCAASVALFCAAASLVVGASERSEALRDSIEVVDARMDAAYSEVLGRHDADIASNPHDAGRAVARCEFIGAFSDAETGRYVAGAPEAFEACVDGLAESTPGDPLVRVYLFEQGRLADAEGAADTLLADSASWPGDLRKRVAATLYWETNDDAARAGDLAVTAAQLGDSQLVGRAVRHLAGLGDDATATALLGDSAPAGSNYSATGRVEAALLLAEPGIALAELRRQEAAGRQVDAPMAARAYIKAGDLDGAREQLQASDDSDDLANAVRFDIAYASRDWASASHHVDLVRSEDFVAHLERFGRLVSAAPSALLQPTLWPSLVVIAAIMLALALLPGMLLIPVHYRGALRRLAGRARVPVFAPVGLRHAWMAMATLLVIPSLILGLVDPAGLSGMLSGESQPDGRALMLTGLWSAALCLTVLAFPLRRFAAADGFGWSRMHRAWWRILLAWAALLAVGALLAAIYQSRGIDSSTDQVRMVADMVNSGRTTWEVGLAFLTVAVLGPVWEEFAFRGLLLGGLARHISFGWANMLQALLFALVHDDAPRFAYYLALGLLTGWLVRSTRSLAPAVVLHILVNMLAFALIMR